jgi:predicted transcriptional regulator
MWYDAASQTLAIVVCCHYVLSQIHIAIKTVRVLLRQRTFSLHKRQGPQVAKCDCCVQIYSTESLQDVLGQHQIQLVLASVQQAEAAAPKPKVGVHCHCSMFVKCIEVSHVLCHQTMLAVLWSCLTATLNAAPFVCCHLLVE